VVKFVFPISLWIISVTVAVAENDATQWLQRMATAIKTLNYKGTFVYIHGRQVEAMTIVHKVDELGEREKLMSLNGAAREIIRDQNKLICILSDNKSVIIEKSRARKIIPDALLMISAKLRKHYRFVVIGNGRMTGRKAKIIAVEPRDKYRYGYRLWLDKRSAMLLKSDVINDKGQVVEQLMFTNLTIVKNIDDSALKPEVAHKDFKVFKQLKKARVQNAPKAWRVSRLPVGYKMKMYTTHDMRTSKMPVDHFVYTDGLSIVSVYIEKPSPDKSKQKGENRFLIGATSMGAINAYGREVAGYQITVVGEVPKASVMLIGRSVEYIGSRK